MGILIKPKLILSRGEVAPVVNQITWITGTWSWAMELVKTGDGVELILAQLNAK